MKRSAIEWTSLYATVPAPVGQRPATGDPQVKLGDQQWYVVCTNRNDVQIAFPRQWNSYYLFMHGKSEEQKKHIRPQAAQSLVDSTWCWNRSPSVQQCPKLVSPTRQASGKEKQRVSLRWWFHVLAYQKPGPRKAPPSLLWKPLCQ